MVLNEVRQSLDSSFAIAWNHQHNSFSESFNRLNLLFSGASPSLEVEMRQQAVHRAPTPAKLAEGNAKAWILASNMFGACLKERTVPFKFSK